MQWDTERSLKTQNLPGTCFERVSSVKYYEMLEALPPQAMVKNAFLVGEPTDHKNGVPVYECYFKELGHPECFRAGIMSEATFKSLLN